MGNLELSGIDMTDKPFLLFYDLKELRHSLKVCVKQCPNRTISKINGIYDYYKETGNKLCQYDFNYNDIVNRSIPNKEPLSGSFGPCPVLPVYER